MQDFLPDIVTGIGCFTSPALIASSARALLATTAVFASSRRRREAALRALRVLNGRHDDNEHRDHR